MNIRKNFLLKVFKIIVLLLFGEVVSNIQITIVKAQVNPTSGPQSLTKIVGPVTLPNAQAFQAPAIQVSTQDNTPQATDINDGLSWLTSYKNRYLGQTTPIISQGKSVNMGFTFGDWSDTSFYNLNAYYREANIFLQDGSSKIQAFYGSGDIGPSSSLDYTVLDSNSSYCPSGSIYAMKNATYFISKNAQGTVQAVKIMGYLNSNNLEVEEVLRPSRYSNGNVAQEFYVKNISTAPQSYTVANEEDTELESSSNNNNAYDNDHVPIYALGNNRGMYIKSPYHRLNINTDIKDGPNRWIAEYFQDYLTVNASGTSSKNDYETGAPVNTRLFKGSTFANATGQETAHYGAGVNLLPISYTTKYLYPDSAYALLWPNQSNLPVGQTKHYAVELGINASSYSKPWLKESWSNQTRSTGKNNPNDQIKFTVQLGNDGQNSEYKTTNLTNLVPTGINVDSSSLRLSVNGSSKAVSYNAANHGVVLSTADAIDLKDNQTATLTFTGTIANSANGTTLTTTPQANYMEQQLSDHTSHNFSTDAITIPVARSIYSTPSLQELWSNQTRTDGKNYPQNQINFTVTLGNKGSNSEYKTTNIANIVPTGIDVDSGSFQLTTPNGSKKTVSYNAANRGIVLNSSDAIDLKYNQTATLTFTGKIANSTDGQTLSTTPNMLIVEQQVDDNPSSYCYGSAINLTVAQDFPSKPFLQETWVNQTINDGNNYTQNQLKFTVTLGNSGNGSEYQVTNITNIVPTGIDVTSGSFQLTNPDGRTKAVSYNPATNSVKFGANDALKIAYNQIATVTFTGTINDSANGKTLTMSPQTTIIDQKVDQQPSSTCQGTALTIPVINSKFSATLTHSALDRTAQKLNRTLPPNYYIPGDQIDFYMDYAISSDSTDTVSTLTFTTRCSSGLTFDNYALADVDGNSDNLKTTFQTDHTTANWPTKVTVTKRNGEPFKAGDHLRLTITGISGNSPDGTHSSSYQSVQHTADVSGTLASGHQIPSDPQTVTVTRQNFAYFTKVPLNLDFGTVLTSGKLMPNKSTSGKLLVNSYFQKSTDNGIALRVAYDNTGANRLINSTDNSSINSDQNSILFYQYSPVLNSGTTVTTIGPSSGSNSDLHGYYDHLTDLTSLVNEGRWQLNAVKGTNPGTYSGKITWSLTNSL